MAPAELVKRLKVSRLFANLDDALLLDIAAEASPRSYAEGDHVWRAGDKATSFTLVTRGLIEVRRTTPSGELALMGLFGPRETVGDFAVMEGGTYPADALAISETLEVLRIHAAPVLHVLGAHPGAAMAVNKVLVSHARVLRSKIDVMSAGSVDKRLAVLLQHLLERFGDEDVDGALHVPLSLSRVQLGRLVGARVETVIRAVSRWQKEGWLTTTSDGFRLTSSAPLMRIIQAD